MKKNIVLSAAAAVIFACSIAVPFTAAADNDEMIEKKAELLSSEHTIGIAGDFTKWNTMNDIQVADPDMDGIYTGVICDVEAGDHKLKIRLDSAWNDNWGAFDEENESAYNSNENYSFSVEHQCDVIVTFDTRSIDYENWTISVYPTETLTLSKYGICGTMTAWGNREDKDIPMYELSENRYIGVIKNAPFGVQEFKVRADNSWDESYGKYEESFDRTSNSQTNCSTELDGTGNVVVELDASGEDSTYWPISFFTLSGKGVLTDVQFTGKEIPEYSYEESSRPDPAVAPVSSDNSKDNSSSDESSEPESLIEFSAASEAEDTVSDQSDSKASGTSETSSSVSVTSAAASGTASGTSTAAASTAAVSSVSASGSETPVTGEAALAISFITLSAAALGAIVLSVSKKERR